MTFSNSESDQRLAERIEDYEAELAGLGASHPIRSKHLRWEINELSVELQRRQALRGIDAEGSGPSE